MNAFLIEKHLLKYPRQCLSYFTWVVVLAENIPTCLCLQFSAWSWVGRSWGLWIKVLKLQLFKVIRLITHSSMFENSKWTPSLLCLVLYVVYCNLMVIWITSSLKYRSPSIISWIICFAWFLSCWLNRNAHMLMFSFVGCLYIF